MQEAASALIQRLESSTSVEQLVEWALSENLSFGARAQALRSLSVRNRDDALRAAWAAVESVNGEFILAGLEVLGKSEPQAVASWIDAKVADPEVDLTTLQVAIGYAPELGKTLAEPRFRA